MRTHIVAVGISNENSRSLSTTPKDLSRRINCFVYLNTEAQLAVWTF